MNNLDLIKNLINENKTLEEIYQQLNIDFNSQEQICPVCGEKYILSQRSFREFKKNHNRLLGCCKKCQNKLKVIVYGIVKQTPEIREKIKQTNLERYGDTCNWGRNSTIKNKSQETMKQRYGVEYALQSEEIQDKVKQTNLERYNVEHPMQSQKIINKIKEINLQKYGVEYIFQSKEIQDKIKQTNLERYGAENVFQSKEIQDKIKQTNLERYGAENVFQSEEIQDKIKQTNLERYGVKYPIQSDLVKEKLKHSIKLKWENSEYKEKLKSILSSIETQSKIYQTKKKNHSFNTSKPEQETYKILKELFNDVQTQYKDERYPYNCDFYIKELDLFIECNYLWTHGSEPYDETNENHRKIVESWKNKNTKFYDNAIDTWTVRDIKKMKCAHENKLNYIVFYSFDEFLNWVNEIFK